MKVDLTRAQVYALLYATGNFTDYEGTGDSAKDRAMDNAEKRLKAALQKEKWQANQIKESNA